MVFNWTDDTHCWETSRTVILLLTVIVLCIDAYLKVLLTGFQLNELTKKFLFRVLLKCKSGISFAHLRLSNKSPLVNLEFLNLKFASLVIATSQV